MSEPPPNGRIDDLGVWGGGGTPLKSVSAYWAGGDIPWITPKDMGATLIRGSQDRLTARGISASGLTIYRPGSIAVVGRSGVLRHTLPVGFGVVPFTVNQDMKVLVPRQGIWPRWAFHQLLHVGQRIIRTAVKAGTTVESLDFGLFRSTGIWLPSLPDQRRIADILDTVDEAIQTTGRVIEKLRGVKRGLLHDLLTRGIDENGELRDPERHPEQFKDSALGRIPNEWGVVPLGALCTLLNGLAFRPEDWTRSGTPIIRIQNLNGSRDFNYYSGVVPPEYVIPQGTLLFSWSGNRGTSFGPYVWTGEEGLLNQHIFKVTPIAGQDPHWFFLSLDTVRETVERRAHGGSGLVHVRRGDLLGYQIAVPNGEEQGRIAHAHLAMEDRLNRELGELSKLRLLKQGLMDDLLTGRVRVKVPAEAA
jgi:type I restriction enzyme S subunit